MSIMLYREESDRPKPLRETMASVGDQEFADKVQFTVACVLAATLRPGLTHVAREATSSEAKIADAMDEALPILNDLAGRLEAEAAEAYRFNIRTAGMNEVIRRGVDENWRSIENLERRMRLG